MSHFRRVLCISLYLLRGRIDYPVKRIRFAVSVGTRLELARLTAIFLPGVAGLVRFAAKFAILPPVANSCYIIRYVIRYGFRNARGRGGWFLFPVCIGGRGGGGGCYCISGRRRIDGGKFAAP